MDSGGADRGLLIACATDTVDDVVEIFRRHGCGRAALIGSMIDGEPVIEAEV